MEKEVSPGIAGGGFFFVVGEVGVMGVMGVMGVGGKGRG